MQGIPLEAHGGMWFLQVEAPPLFGRQVTMFLNKHFWEHWIGRSGLTYWRARSSDLSPLDFFYAVALNLVCTLIVTYAKT